MYRRVLLSFVIGLFLAMTTASSALAWSGTFDYGWNNEVAGAEFSQSDGNHICPTTTVVLIWAGNQTEFFAANPSDTKYSWVYVHMYKVDCYANYSDRKDLFAYLPKKPTNKNNGLTVEKFLENGSLRVHMPMSDSVGTKYNVHIDMTLRGGTPYFYAPGTLTITTDPWTYARELEYGVMYTFLTAKVDLKMNNIVILNDVLNNPDSGYTQRSDYVERTLD